MSCKKKTYSGEFKGIPFWAKITCDGCHHTATYRDGRPPMTYAVHAHIDKSSEPI